MFSDQIIRNNTGPFFYILMLFHLTLAKCDRKMMRRLASHQLRFAMSCLHTGQAGLFSTQPPQTTGAAVMVSSPPEFDGETSGPTAPLSKTKPTTVTGSALPKAAVVDVRKFLSGVQSSPPPSESDTQRISEAYLKYFDHIRFRNGWAKPAFTKDEVQHLFDEAAYFVARIRQYLDKQSSGEARLRQVDGEAQKYLHTEQAPALLRTDPRRFMIAVVDATFQDARGYVEGLTRSTLMRLIAELAQYQYNPRIHALHLVARLEDALQKSPLASEAEVLTDELVAVRDNHFYVEDGSPADEKWRELVRKMYLMVDEIDATLKSSTKKKVK